MIDILLVALMVLAFIAVIVDALSSESETAYIVKSGYMFEYCLRQLHLFPYARKENRRWYVQEALKSIGAW